jgi:hypothetical protein
VERRHFVEFQQANLEMNASDFIIECLEGISRWFVMSTPLLKSQLINNSHTHCLNIVFEFFNNNLLVLPLHKFVVPVAF